MDRRDFLKTVAITGAALSIQHSEAMEILTQTINNTVSYTHLTLPTKA